MSSDLPELPSTHIRPFPELNPVIHDAVVPEHHFPTAHTDRELQAMNTVFSDEQSDAAGAVFALWGAGVILDGLIDDAQGIHGPGEPPPKKDKKEDENP